jgi:cysteine desulfurase
MFGPKRVFLDFASTTPTDPRVVKAMLLYFSTTFHNPSALYREGAQTQTAVEAARAAVARELNAKADTIVFTSGGTESVNMAIRGAVHAARHGAKPIASPHIVTTQIEHPAVIETCKALEKDGVRVTYVAPTEQGIVRPADIIAALTPQTVLVAVMYVNNEIGTIQPLRNIGQKLSAYREAHNTLYPYFYTDASQAGAYLSLATNALGVDLLTLDGSKIYGPKGVGVLYMHPRVQLTPLITGGGQERGRRAGTENVPLIVGFAEALSIVRSEREHEVMRLTELRDYFIDSLLALSPRISLNGSRSERLPNNINVCIEGLDAEFAVVQLDMQGVACASVTSCKYVDDSTTSYVVESLGETKRGCGESSLRFSVGRTTTRKDIDFTLKIVENILKNH